MESVSEGAFGPEQLASIRESFDEAIEDLRERGHVFPPGGIDRLGEIVIRMSAGGLRERDLVEAAVRATLRR